MRRPFFFAVLAVGTLLRLLHVFTSLGSTDALLWYRWVELIDRVGILKSYGYSPLMNHPPLALAIAQLTARAGETFGFEFQTSFRLLQTVADIITFLSLTRIARTVSPLQTNAAALFFLSPAAIFVTGFHCNSDPLMIMLLVLAIEAAILQRPVLSGVAIAAAVGIKIVPLLVLPFLVLAFRRRMRVLMIGTCAACGAAIFVPGIVVSGTVFLRNVFGWSGMPVTWGVRFIVWISGSTLLHNLGRFLSVVTIVVLAVIWFLEWRTTHAVVATRLPALTALVFLVLLVFAPGFGIQYLFWPLPFLAFLFGRRATLALHGMITINVFLLYTAWSGGWPWWYADSTKPAGELAAFLTFALWLVLAGAAVAGVRRLRVGRTNAAAPG